MTLQLLFKELYPVEQDPDGKTIDTDNTAGPAAVWTLARGQMLLARGETYSASRY